MHSLCLASIWCSYSNLMYSTFTDLLHGNREGISLLNWTKLLKEISSIRSRLRYYENLEWYFCYVIEYCQKVVTQERNTNFFHQPIFCKTSIEVVPNSQLLLRDCLFLALRLTLVMKGVTILKQGSFWKLKEQPNFMIKGVMSQLFSACVDTVLAFNPININQLKFRYDYFKSNVWGLAIIFCNLAKSQWTCEISNTMYADFSQYIDSVDCFSTFHWRRSQK